MGFLTKMLKTGWRDRLARGDAARDAEELASALGHYRSALGAFDGTDAEREELGERAAAVRGELRQRNLRGARASAAKGDHEEALSSLVSAADYSEGDEEQGEVASIREEIVTEHGLAPEGAGKLLGEPRPEAVPRRKARHSIHYLVTPEHPYTMAAFLETWGASLAGTIDVIPYSGLSSLEGLRRGTYVFSDLERLGPAQLAMVTELAELVEAAGDGCRVLNHPARVLRRHDLLVELAGRGQNPFGAYRLGALPAALRWPVFVRLDREHEGSLTDLIDDRGRLDEAIGDLMLHGFAPEEMHVVEYVETADEDGLYRKYSAFKVADRIVPRHLLFGYDWNLKYPQTFEPELIEEEWRYLESNPHEAELEELFDIAAIDYGRIDYSVADGKLVVWEINTNPIVLQRPEKYGEAHYPIQEWFAPRIVEAFEALDAGPPPEGLVPLRLDLARIRAIVDENS